MSEWLQAILLAFVQGLTEFLPISSSAHLILPAQLFGWADQGVAFDIAVHVGSLLAVLLYFRSDLQALLVGSLRAVGERRMNAEALLVWHLAIATLPVALAGLLLSQFVTGQLRSVPVIAAATIGFGILLLSIPVILAAGLLAGVEANDLGQGMRWAPTLLATVIAAMTAYTTIALFLAWVQRLGFLPFAIYRCLLGIVLLLVWA